MGEVRGPASRWVVEQVEALCPSRSRLAAARGLAVADRWNALGAHRTPSGAGPGAAGTIADERGVLWGRYQGTGGEPYEVMVDHVQVAARCTCPARSTPCKHALALLLLWVHGDVPDADAPPGVVGWLARAAPTATDAPATAPVGGAPPTGPSSGGRDASAAPTGAPPSPPPERPARGRDERVARLAPALAELDRWLTDRLRTGLADPALARYQTWDELAARLVDAQAGALANRLRRLGGQVGARPGWHEHVLAEMGVLHLLAEGGRRLAELPPPLADGVAVALGWQVRQADVLAGVPERDRWFVVGRSDTAEDRIVVRRTWLWGTTSHQWAMVLGFAAHGQGLDDSLVVGCSFDADLYRYPGAVPLRALVGLVHDGPRATDDLFDRLPAATLSAACDEVGRALAAEPWLERHPSMVRAQLAPSGRAWVLTDDGGSLPVHPDSRAVPELLACTAEQPAVVTVEWTPHGWLPVAVHLAGRSVDLGPRIEQVGRWR